MKNCINMNNHTEINNTQEEPKKLVCKVMEFVKSPRAFRDKFLLQELEIVQRIRRARISHVNHVHHVLQLNSKIMFFTSYANYGTLADYIKSSSEPMDHKLLRKWFTNLAVGLAHLHQIEVVHRNISCENILINANFKPVLSDFSFTRLSINNKGKPIFSSTFCGPLGYVPPEILIGVPYIPKLADIWSLGVVLFIMVNGKMPFPEQNTIKLHKAQVKKDYKFRTSVLKKISKEVVFLIEGMLEPRWFDRMTTNELMLSPFITTSFFQADIEITGSKIATQVRNLNLKEIKRTLKNNRKLGNVQDVVPESELTESIYSDPDTNKIQIFKRLSQVSRHFK